MAEPVAARFTWAVDMLDIQPDDHVLEIGCGHGVAISLVCDRLVDGKISAIDRSVDMIALATQKNQQHIRSGKADIQAQALEHVDFTDQRFDCIFAINVGLFEQQADRGLDVISNMLATDGRLFVFYQPPHSEKTALLANRTVANLEANGYGIVDVTFVDFDAATATSIQATLG